MGRCFGRPRARAIPQRSRIDGLRGSWGPSSGPSGRRGPSIGRKSAQGDGLGQSAAPKPRSRTPAWPRGATGPTLRDKAAEPGSSDLWDQLTTFDAGSEIGKNALLAALADGRMDSARSHLDALSPMERDKPPFDRLQALMAYDQGDFGRAAALLKSLPHQPDTLLVLADVYLHLGDPGQALTRSFTTRCLPSSPTAYRWRWPSTAPLWLSTTTRLWQSISFRAVNDGPGDAGLGMVRLADSRGAVPHGRD